MSITVDRQSLMVYLYDQLGNKKEYIMSDHNLSLNLSANDELTEEFKFFLNETKDRLKGADRRQYMARAVQFLGYGGQLRAERELRWDRKTIIKGMKEISSGITCIDNFAARGRKAAEAHLPDLLNDIKSILDPVCQTDPTFRTPNMYSPLTAKEVRRRLIDDIGYSPITLPQMRTIAEKMNQLGFKLKKVAKSKPKKKIAQTDAIFQNVHHANQLADDADGVIRLSIDTKSNVLVGQFARGGYNRCAVAGCDHDFAPDFMLKPFGICLPALNENYIYFTESFVTADFIVDALADLWPMLKLRFDPHTIVINADNGPENSSRRTQFIKRIVEFAESEKIDIELVYYPPYHSKYNPIERVWGVLERHWNGEILDSIDKVLGLCRTMTWKGKYPIVKMVKKVYDKGIKLTKKAMMELEQALIRKPGIEKWAVSIHFFQ